MKHPASAVALTLTAVLPLGARPCSPPDGGRAEPPPPRARSPPSRSPPSGSLLPEWWISINRKQRCDGYFDIRRLVTTRHHAETR